MNGMEPDGGNSLADIRQIGQAFEKAGADAIHVSVGFAATIKDPTFIPSIPSMRLDDGPIVHLAENIKKGVQIPVIAVNKIRTPQFAEKILQEGKADMIALGRTLVADPNFVNKIIEEKYDDIRPCISCCQGCIQNVVEKDLPMACTVNPMAGREGEFKLEKADKQKKVLIAGGGPGGLEAAIIAAKRGLAVTISEKRNKLGGDNLIPPILGVENDIIVSALDVLNQKVELGKNIVIIGGGQTGLKLAEFLGENGKKPIVIEMQDNVGAGMPSQVKTPLMFSLEDFGVNIITMAEAKEITKDGVMIIQGGQERHIDADTVILASGFKGKPEFNKKYPDTIVAFVELKTQDGTLFEQSVIYPKGNPKNKMSKNEVQAKFRDLALLSLDKSKVGNLFEKFMELEKINDIIEIIPLLIK